MHMESSKFVSREVPTQFEKGFSLDLYIEQVSAEYNGFGGVNQSLLTPIASKINIAAETKSTGEKVEPSLRAPYPNRSGDVYVVGVMLRGWGVKTIMTPTKPNKTPVVFNVSLKTEGGDTIMTYKVLPVLRDGTFSAFIPCDYRIKDDRLVLEIVSHDQTIEGVSKRELTTGMITIYCE